MNWGYYEEGMTELPGLHETISNDDSLGNQGNMNQLGSNYIKGHKREVVVHDLGFLDWAKT